MQLVIIAGGKGTRLKKRTADLQKCMVEVGTKPLIEHQILLAASHKITDILILAGFDAESIERHFGDGTLWGVNVRYHRESEVRGTAGAVIDAFDKLEDVFFVVYGDTMLNVDLARMAAAHAQHPSATLFLHPNDHPHDSDLVELNESNEIVAFHAYPHPPGEYFANLVNAGLYVVSKEILSPWHTNRNAQSYPLDFAKHVFPNMLAGGAKLYGYVSREYIKDAGTPERLDRVRLDYSSGRIGRGSLHNPAPAVFLDRDGTLNYERGWLNRPEQLELLPGAAAAVRAINEAGWLAVVVSNQPVIARGGCTETELRKIHNKLEWLLGENGAFVNGIYYCPHHPDKGFAGERPELKMACSCRKPATGLLDLASRELNINTGRSWLVGDSARDIEAANNFGIRSALVRAGSSTVENLGRCKPDLQCDTLLDATELILNKSTLNDELVHS
jgi:histidinol-phosphate phosphatase family protein